ncbi:hypothetical protein EYF80_057518 [Liparis tanakae]|uniref:Uncharacterized protein n=1 Tax=Liparis tanakae TaxID=230148 RepID=A0A4Z2EU63_9TELE|nr:hypothetical protein EYF80_057518 [Liparis tanakae]
MAATLPIRVKLHGVLTVVHCQNLPAVHLHKVAQRELSVVDPQLLGPLEREALHTEPRQEADQRQTHLVVVVVHQASDHVGLAGVQLLQHVGGVRRQVDQLLLRHHLTVVLRLNGPDLLDWRKTPSLVLLHTGLLLESLLTFQLTHPLSFSSMLCFSCPPRLVRYNWGDPEASPASRQSVTNLHRMHRPPVLRVAALHLSVELPHVLKTRPHYGGRRCCFFSFRFRLQRNREAREPRVKGHWTSSPELTHFRSSLSASHFCSFSSFFLCLLDTGWAPAPLSGCGLLPVPPVPVPPASVSVLLPVPPASVSVLLPVPPASVSVLRLLPVPPVPVPPASVSVLRLLPVPPASVSVPPASVPRLRSLSSAIRSEQ